MHDCPNCQVPLHGHEEVCPSCGMRQVVFRPYYAGPAVETERGLNPVPIIVVVAILFIGAVVAFNGSWVGELLRQGPPAVDPISKLTPLEAREAIESKITEGLAAVGSKGRFAWTHGGEPADKTSDQPLELAVKTRLKDAQSRKAIIDPVKPYMDRAKVPTLTMTDERSGAVWTYTVVPAATGTNSGDDGSKDPDSQ